MVPPADGTTQTPSATRTFHGPPAGDQLPALLGADDEPDAFRPRHRVVAAAHRKHGGLRLPYRAGDRVPRAECAGAADHHRQRPLRPAAPAEPVRRGARASGRGPAAEAFQRTLGAPTLSPWAISTCPCRSAMPSPVPGAVPASRRSSSCNRTPGSATGQPGSSSSTPVPTRGTAGTLGSWAWRLTRSGGPRPETRTSSVPCWRTTAPDSPSTVSTKRRITPGARGSTAPFGSCGRAGRPGGPVRRSA